MPIEAKPLSRPDVLRSHLAGFMSRLETIGNGNEVDETRDWYTSTYDRAGNMTTLTSGNTAQYDAWNHLVEVDDASGIVERNEYDGTGRRIQIFSDFTGSTPGTVVDDYHSGQQMIETRENSTVKYQTIWSPRFIDAPILRDTYSGGSLVAAARVFYLADANYNVTGLVKYDSGAGQWAVAERYSYTPYGVVTYRNADWTTATSSANANTTLYTGRELDLLTLLNYNRARFYDAALERFVNRDPIGYRGGINLYEYVGDRPTNFTDPNGFEPAASDPDPAPPGCGLDCPGPSSDSDGSLELIMNTVQAGPCQIKLWMGDTRDSRDSLNPFYNGNSGVSGVYMGVVGCGAYGPGGTQPGSLPAIPTDQQIPGFPTCGGQNGGLSYAELAGAVRDALDAARAQVKQLCEGQRCTSVTLSVQYTKLVGWILNQTTQGKSLLKQIKQLQDNPKKTTCCPQNPEK